MDSPAEIARAVAAISRIDAVPTLLKVLSEMSGMRFSAVVRVTGKTWTACAVRDDLHLGIQPADELTFLDSFGVDPRTARSPVVIEHAGADIHHRYPKYPALRALESFVSVPIIIEHQRHFGALCAVDTNPTKLAEPRILSMFNEFAALIAAQYEHQSIREKERTALLDERATNELREQFIAILGHDLRNPLQAVFAAGDLLERRLTDPALLLLASRIKTNVRRMSSLIDDVLDFARGRLGGGIGLELTEVDNVNNGLTTVIQELQDAQPDVKIISNISVDRSVRCDLGRLQQVASNLLGNALTHGATDSPVRITARADEHDLVLEVWNDGTPIAPENMHKIFEPFWRNSVSASRNGLGLGLHICSQIVRAHHGRMSVDSSQQHGTRFTARLPLQAGHSISTLHDRSRSNGSARPNPPAASSTESRSLHGTSM